MTNSDIDALQRLLAREAEQNATILALRDQLAKAEALLRRFEPHVDAIVCYASTMGEHEPNKLAADLRTYLTAGSSAR